MDDIIEESIKEYENYKDRTAEAVIRFHKVTLYKEKSDIQHMHGDRNLWRIHVFVGDGRTIGTRIIDNLSAEEADRKFEELVDKYNMRETSE